VGGHEHFNWGFTTNGIYRLYFQASGVLAANSQRYDSAITPFTFYVLPLAPFELWQTNQWPCECDTNIIDASANPDKDDMPNLFEYARGANPNASNSTPFFTLDFIQTNGSFLGRVSYDLTNSVTNTVCDVLARANLASTNCQVLTNIQTTTDGSSNTHVRVLDSIATTNTPQRYYNMRVRLK
jgi:surface-anchored protein